MNKRTQLKLVKAMSKIRGGLDDDAMPTLYLDRDEPGQVVLSAEDGQYFADYYGEYRGGYPYIDERIEKAAANLGLYWEWENAGALIAYEV